MHVLAVTFELAIHRADEQWSPFLQNESKIQPLPLQSRLRRPQVNLHLGKRLRHRLHNKTPLGCLILLRPELLNGGERHQSQ